ncbi:MAG: hypothetical protein J6S67_15595 [Methanobrevibacter sp.]|nr:hypothetical protein [Methanobrevibacter sp.]
MNLEDILAGWNGCTCSGEGGEGGGGVVIVTSTMDEDFTVTLSKTYAELADSLSNGVPVFWVSSNPYGYSMYPLLLCENNDGCVVTFMGTEGAVTFSCASENDYPYQED